MDKILQKIYKGVQEVPLELERFFNNKYPDFVTNNNLDVLQGEVPVFMFHTVNGATLQKQLAFLKLNGYQTLKLSTFMAFLQGEIELKQPSVLLTFDDGEKSWYNIAYPLLKQYQFHAVGFLVPFYLQQQTEQKNGKQWLSWSEVIEMEKSGVFEFGSHSHYHDRIFIEPKLIDFFNPDFPNALGLDAPWIEVTGIYTNQLKWGTPIYRYAPRLAGNPRYIDDSKIRDACVSWVETRGGAEFFQRSSWRQELKHIYQTLRGQISGTQYESKEKQKQQMLSDLVQAKQILSERLNKPIQHLCYPWGIGSELAISLSQEVGYISNFWVVLDKRNTNCKGDSPFYIPRLKDDYLFRLPGQGRKPLRKIFQEKLRRRTTTVELY